MSPSTDQKHRAALYREAARLVEEQWPEDQWGACDGIARANGLYKDCKEFESWFRPTIEEQCAYDGGERVLYWMGDPHDPECHGPRILALGFMAAMVEAGDA